MHDVMDRTSFATHILQRLEAEQDALAHEFRQPGRVQSFVLDDLLDPALASAIYRAFPPPGAMVLKKSIREHKLVAVQMDRYERICEEIIYAFQDRRIVEALQRITGINELHADGQLYAGGLSLMAKGHYLLPHLDNSHDKDRSQYRVLNLLYYVTPDWQLDYGGNLELWDQGPKGSPRVIHSRFNRLVCMATDRRSWHSVQKVLHDGMRCCVSNYYFSPRPIDGSDYFHVTSFRGRPEQPVRDVALWADIVVRQALRQLFPKGVRENPHVYKKPDGDHQDQ